MVRPDEDFFIKMIRGCCLSVVLAHSIPPPQPLSKKKTGIWRTTKKQTL